MPCRPLGQGADHQVQVAAVATPAREADRRRRDQGARHGEWMNSCGTICALGRASRAAITAFANRSSAASSGSLRSVEFAYALSVKQQIGIVVDGELVAVHLRQNFRE